MIKNLTIGVHQYAIRHAPATASLRALGVMANAFGPLVEGMKGGKGFDDRMLGSVAEVLSNPALGPSVIELCQIFAPYTEVMQADPKAPGGAISFSLFGQNGKFDEHFAGNLMACMTWLKASVEHNLGNFLGEIGALLKEKSSKPAQPGVAEEPSNSNGPSSVEVKPGSGA